MASYLKTVLGVRIYTPQTSLTPKELEYITKRPTAWLASLNLSNCVQPYKDFAIGETGAHPLLTTKLIEDFVSSGKMTVDPLVFWNYFKHISCFYNADNDSKMPEFREQIELMVKKCAHPRRFFDKTQTIETRTMPEYVDFRGRLIGIPFGWRYDDIVASLYLLTTAFSDSISSAKDEFSKHKNMYSIQTKVYKRIKIHKLLREKIWHPIHKKHLLKRMKDLCRFHASVQNIVNQAKCLKKTKLLIKGGADPITLRKKDDDESRSTNTLKTEILKELSIEVNKMRIVDNNDLSVNKVNNRLSDLESLAPKIMMDVEEQRSQLISFAANQVVLHEKIHTIGEMHTQVSENLASQAEQMQQAQNLILIGQANMDKYEADNAKIANKYKSDRKKIKNLIKELSDTVITFNTETKRNSTFLSENCFQLRDSMDERVKQLMEDIKKHEEKAAEFSVNYQSKLSEEARRVEDDTIKKIEANCHRFFAESNTIFENVRKSLLRVEEMSETLRTDIAQLRGEKNALISEMAKLRNSNKTTTTLQVVQSGKRQQEVQSEIPRQLDRPLSKNKISEWNRLLKDSVYYNNITEWMFKPYLDPTNEMPYDHRMSYDEWDWQRNRNAQLRNCRNDMKWVVCVNFKPVK